MVVLVCGSRDWKDRDAILTRLEALSDEDDDITVIHGGATGADSAAGGIATGLGYGTRCYFPDWKKHGKKAGILRNQQMLDDGKPDLVIAFWDGASRGTDDMIKRARKAGVQVEVIGPLPMKSDARQEDK